MPAPDRSTLLSRWNSLCSRLYLSGAEDTFDLLYTSYTAPDRHYHDVRHIAASLDELDARDRAGQQCREPDAIELAIWFHDCVYDAKRLDNEEQSAEVAETELAELGADPH